MRLSDLVYQNETRTLAFDGFGKRGIVRHRLSPDAVVQLALQHGQSSRLGGATAGHHGLL